MYGPAVDLCFNILRYALALINGFAIAKSSNKYGFYMVGPLTFNLDFSVVYKLLTLFFIAWSK